MIIMKNDIVTSNLRLPRQDWLMIKTLAAEEGKSFNEYMRALAENMALSLTGENEGKRGKKLSIWDLPRVARGIKGKPMGANEDDKIIYGIE